MARSGRTARPACRVGTSGQGRRSWRSLGYASHQERPRAQAPTVLRALLELEGVGLCAREAQQQAAEGERARETQRDCGTGAGGEEETAAHSSATICELRP